MTRFMKIAVMSFIFTWVVVYVVTLLLSDNTVHASTSCTPYATARGYGHMRDGKYTVECDINTGLPISINGMEVRTTGTHELVPTQNSNVTSVVTSTPTKQVNATPKKAQASSHASTSHSSHNSRSSQSGHTSKQTSKYNDCDSEGF
jgi:hypothetical protein